MERNGIGIRIQMQTMRCNVLYCVVIVIPNARCMQINKQTQNIISIRRLSIVITVLNSIMGCDDSILRYSIFNLGIIVFKLQSL